MNISYILMFLICLVVSIQLDECARLTSDTFSKAQNRACFIRNQWEDIIQIQRKVCRLFQTFESWVPFLTQPYVDLFPIHKFGSGGFSNEVKITKNVLFSVVTLTPFSTKPKLVGLSRDVLTNHLNLHPSVENCSHFINFISGDSTKLHQPPALAHRYGGHQFGYWAGQLGDGRAALLGSFRRSDGAWVELNLKGSGKTPYSRQGDGRAVLRSSVREFLASEAMHSLGIPTSRALSLVVSDDPVVRDQFYTGHPTTERGAMVVRVASSWFRIGSLEILASNGETQLLRQLLDHVIEHHFGQIDKRDEDRYLMLFSEIVNGTAELIAAWQSVGFAHGVLNTDNLSLLSITIDYGPFGFLDKYDEDFVPNTSDDEGRYSYARQPSVGFFNLDKLRIALGSVLTSQQQATAKVILEGYHDIIRHATLRRFTEKLGFMYTRSSDDQKLVNLFLRLLKETQADFTMAFRQLGEVSLDDLRRGAIDDSMWALKDLISLPKRFDRFMTKYTERLEESQIEDFERRSRMCRINPVYVLRNWMAQTAIEQAENDDFTGVRSLLHVLQSPYKRQVDAERAGYSSRSPWWASDIRVSCSS